MVPQVRSTLVAGALLLAALCGMGTWQARVQGETDPQPKPETKTNPGAKKIAMKVFMRKKLTASQDIIEGLALEDFELIEKGAKQLKAMSAAAEFVVVSDPIYASHADDFRRAVSKMERAAREKRIDGATLGYVDMTMTCVECHKFVRTIKIAKN